MRENTTRWKDNGLPRKGWYIETVDELEDISEACEWCGTSIRFVYYLRHWEQPDLGEHIAGCLCTQKLTEDYELPKELRDDYMKQKRKKQRWAAFGWRQNDKGNYYRFINGVCLTVFYHTKPYSYDTRENGWKWVYDGRFSDRVFQSYLLAKADAYLHLNPED